jgi:ribose transport system substrate-binding protein
VPIPGVVTDENFDEAYAEVADLSASYTLDGMLSAEEAEAFFE